MPACLTATLAPSIYADLEAFTAIARSLPDQTFVRCSLSELHSAKVKVRPRARHQIEQR